jgi:adenosylcobyric acid synthase
VLQSFARVGEGVDVVLVEGAGSPAEVNLRAGDIANMGFAEAADVPVVLVGDIDRGGVIASLVGTHAVLGEADRARIRGFVINKFRGDAGLFSEGLRLIEARTGWPSLGVVPWLPETARLPAEDSLGLHAEPAERQGPPPGLPLSGGGGRRLVVAVPSLPRIANFDDLDPLRAEPGVSVRIVRPGEPVPAEAGLVLIPGTKATLSDLAFLRAEGWDIDIAAHVRRGGAVIGLCGGYQMLGQRIADPGGADGRKGEAAGLGLLDVETVMDGDKITVPVTGRDAASREAVSGYEIHLGRTQGPDCSRPFLDLGGRPDGARSADGRVVGSYVHGLYASDGFRRAFLAGLGAAASELGYEQSVEDALDALAEHLETHIDVDRLLKIAGITPAR